MNIQIFGKSKCFDTKKAERYFKERRVKFQAVDILRYGMSRGELQSVVRAVGLDALVDWKTRMPPCSNTWPMTMPSWTSSLRTPGSSGPPWSATESWPPWATSPRCGKGGSSSTPG